MLLQTPKYGLIYHASLIGQAPPKYKGKISRVLAAKCALSIRVDALGDTEDATVGLEARQKVPLQHELLCTQPQHALLRYRGFSQVGAFEGIARHL